MRNLVGPALRMALLLVPACSQQVAASVSDVVSVQDQKFLNVIERSTLAEVALGKLAAQKGTTPVVRLFDRWMASTDSLAHRQLASMMTEKHGPMLPTSSTIAAMLGTSWSSTLADHVARSPRMDPRALTSEFWHKTRNGLI